MGIEAPKPTTNYVTSADGTRIAYLTQAKSNNNNNNGPGILLIQGAMADVHAFQTLSSALSTSQSSFTVHTLERRGRGLSPLPYNPTTHSITRDVEDIAAVLTATGARHLFGLSSGAIIVLEAASKLLPSTGTQIDSIAVFEPPFYTKGREMPRDGMERLNANIEKGKYSAALIDALDTAGTAPPAIKNLPRPVARLLAKGVLAVDHKVNSNKSNSDKKKKNTKRERSGSTSMKDLLPGVRYDFHDVSEVNRRGGIDSFALTTNLDNGEKNGGLRVPVLVISGTESPEFLRDAAGELGDKLGGAAFGCPYGVHVVMEGVGHDGPWNNGEPEEVARKLVKFFGTPVGRFYGSS